MEKFGHVTPAAKGILVQYADNTPALLSYIYSAQTLFRSLDDFEKISGLAVNLTKAEAMWIGSLRENKSTPFGIKWTLLVSITLMIRNYYMRKTS